MVRTAAVLQRAMRCWHYCLLSIVASSYFKLGEPDRAALLLIRETLGSRLVPAAAVDSRFVAAAKSFDPDASPSRDLAPDIHV